MNKHKTLFRLSSFYLIMVITMCTLACGGNNYIPGSNKDMPTKILYQVDYMRELDSIVVETWYNPITEQYEFIWRDTFYYSIYKTGEELELFNSELNKATLDTT